MIIIITETLGKNIMNFIIGKMTTRCGNIKIFHVFVFSKTFLNSNNLKYFSKSKQLVMKSKLKKYAF